MPHEGVCLMTGHAGLALLEWIGLQLRHLIAVAGFACAQTRDAREVLCCCFAMAHGAFHTVGAVRTGFPLGKYRLVAVGTGFPGRKQPMDNVLALRQLGHGRLNGSSHNEKSEKGRTKETHAETSHWQIS